MQKPVQLAPHLLEELTEVGEVRSLAAGTVLLENGSYIRSIPIVLSGSIKVLKQDDEGKEMLLYYIRPGESCVMSFLGGIDEETSKVKAVVEEDAEVLLLPLEQLNKMIHDEYGLVKFMFRLYHQRFEELLSVLNAVAFKKMDERLWQLLQKKASLSASNQLLVTHQQLAEELATDRVVISRLLKQLENEGKIEMGRNKISLL
jgi:CRP/FNR family transcriptional regulator, anaerobic regulatory protein